MNFNKHSDLEGLHAFLSPSQWHWLNYDQDKLISVYTSKENLERGTRYHNIASLLIKDGIKLPKSKKSLNAFVNDAIGYGMESEQPLIYSMNCFGTADAISFDGKTLRIHDLKTGSTPAHMEQLIIYAALFCMEYGYNPKEIEIELRIYQFDEVTYHVPSEEEIRDVIDIIVKHDKTINELKKGVSK